MPTRPRPVVRPLSKSSSAPRPNMWVMLPAWSASDHPRTASRLTGAEGKSVRCRSDLQAQTPLSARAGPREESVHSVYTSVLAPGGGSLCITRCHISGRTSCERRGARARPHASRAAGHR
ncbi:hypothetical protein NDU88_002179 [Pleurodeles waltl]|uniref:Uncharacterized protein n=1 Tax=Pleurodeles waltl TaxID=8319 RepID=A0AAV7MPT0_PLEWA|nr:hypothetical protein NDU88_002179 [Pleurodeles waltl]